MRQRREGRATDEQRVESIKELIYVSFTVLAVLIVLAVHGEADPFAALVAVSVTTVAMAFSILAATVLSHLVVHDEMLGGKALRHVARSSLGSLVSVIPAAVVFALSIFGAIPHAVAPWVAIGLSVASLASISLIAVRKTPIPWWARILGVGGALLLIAVVVVSQILAHS